MTTPSEAEAKRLLASAGIQSAPEQACDSADAAVAAAELFGFPVVMKILSPDIVHKSEIGGVLLNVADVAAVRDGYDLLIARAKRAAPTARIEGVLVAKQLQGGVECILGIHRDPVFGPIAMFGLGGIFVEVMKDVVFRRCPFGDDVAEQMIRSIKGAPLLLGARGRPRRTSRRWRTCWRDCRPSRTRRDRGWRRSISIRCSPCRRGTGRSPWMRWSRSDVKCSRTDGNARRNCSA